MLIEQKRGQGWAKKKEKGENLETDSWTTFGTNAGVFFCLDVCVDDPSAGSPTETLLQLLLTGRINQVTASVFARPEGLPRIGHHWQDAVHSHWDSPFSDGERLRYVSAWPPKGLPPRHLSRTAAREG